MSILDVIPSLTINVGKRPKGAEEEKPSAKLIEPQSTSVVVPAPQAGKTDLLMVVLVCLAVSLVLLSAATVVYAARR